MGNLQSLLFVCLLFVAENFLVFSDVEHSLCCSSCFQPGVGRLDQECQSKMFVLGRHFPSRKRMVQNKMLFSGFFFVVI